MYKKITSGYVPICEKCGYAVGVVCDTEMECYDYIFCKKCDNYSKIEPVQVFYNKIKDCTNFNEMREVLHCTQDKLYYKLRYYGFSRIYSKFMTKDGVFSVYVNGNMKLTIKTSERIVYHDALSGKEEEMVRLFKQGLSVGEVAKELKVSDTTIRNKLISMGAKTYTYKEYKVKVYVLDDFIVYPKSNAKSTSFRVAKTIKMFEKEKMFFLEGFVKNERSKI